jgi:hypothetical protein
MLCPEGYLHIPVAVCHYALYFAEGRTRHYEAQIRAVAALERLPSEREPVPVDRNDREIPFAGFEQSSRVYRPRLIVADGEIGL